MADYREKLKELNGSTLLGYSELQAITNSTEFRRRAVDLGLKVKVTKVTGPEWRSKGAILDDYRKKLKELQRSTLSVRAIFLAAG